MAVKDFGKPIKLDKPYLKSQSGNEMITKANELNNKYYDKLLEMVGDDEDAKRFFCKPEEVYVFPVSSVKKLMKKLDKPDDCILLFSGARIDPENLKVKGRPTLLAFAYKNDGKILHFEPVDSDIDGFEHPGGFLKKTEVEKQGSSTIEKDIPIPNLGII